MVGRRRNFRTGALWVLVFLILTACGTQPTKTPSPKAALLLSTPVGTSNQASLAVALTQQKNTTDNQAIATAEIVSANAQATLNSANATVQAVQTQDQNEANVIAAQIAATAEIERANAQATLNSAGATQSAALTQDAIRQTEMADQATTSAEAIVNQQNMENLAAGTQTSVANNIATQTQVAVATSQWFADQARLRDEQRQVPIAFLWMWCFPVFIILFAGLCLWGFWRWLKIKQKRQRTAGQPIEILQDKFLEPDSDTVNGRYRLTQPDDQMRGWLDEIKRKLITRDKDKDDNSNG